MPPRKLFRLALLGLALVGSGALCFYQLPRLRLVGYYQRAGGSPTTGLQQIEITRDRFIFYLSGAGPLAQEYSLDGNRIYVGAQPSQLLFTIDGLGIISQQGSPGIEGTYIKYVKE